MAAKKGLLERLDSGEAVICAEGFLFEFEQQCYLKAGSFVPEVILEHPDLLRQLHRQFAHAGSDVVLAFTYYTHREKMRLVGREDDIEVINQTALQIAKEVAEETDSLFAGNICNSTLYKPTPEVNAIVYSYFKEQLGWIAAAGVDFIVAETFETFGEAELALKACKEFAPGIPLVLTLTVPEGGLYDGVPVAEACLCLEQMGADVVGINCVRGPKSALPLMKQIREVCKGHLACVPVPYRTTPALPTFQILPDVEHPDYPAFPVNLDAWLCSVDQIEKFTQEAWDMGVHYLGICCGNKAHYTRAMAMVLGRNPPAAKYAPDMSKHYSRIKGDRRYSYIQRHFRQRYRTKTLGEDDE